MVIKRTKLKRLLNLSVFSLIFTLFFVSCDTDSVENGGTGATLKAFNTPAFIGKTDLSSFPVETKESFLQSWNDYVNSWTESAIHVGLEPENTNSLPGDYYFNPLKENPDSPTITVPVRWNSFPYRIRFYFEDELAENFKDSITVGGVKYPMSTYSLYELADLGPEGFKKKYPSFNQNKLPSNLCGNIKFGNNEFTPIGPRGWLDEYCEFSVERDDTGEIVTAMYTSENPEYYWTLWSVSPEAVLDIYQKSLKNENIKLEDLYLYADGKPVRTEIGYAYNPINKWNVGTTMSATGGGAVHLTSSPNELSAEIILAAGACIPRPPTGNGNSNSVSNDLICCAEYGRRFRNSDPHIGQSVNQAISNGDLKLAGTLLNPVGLYMQLPNFEMFSLPADLEAKGHTFEECWHVLRGDAESNYYPNSTVLRAEFRIPEDWNIKASDITVAGNPLLFASQISETMEVQLVAVSKAMESAAPIQECVTARNVPLPSVASAMFMDTYNGFVASGVDSLSNFSANPVITSAGTIQDSIYLIIAGFDAGVKDFEVEFYNTFTGEKEDMSFSIENSHTGQFEGMAVTFLMGAVQTGTDVNNGGKSVLVKNMTDATQESFLTPAFFRVK